MGATQEVTQPPDDAGMFGDHNESAGRTPETHGGTSLKEVQKAFLTRKKNPLCKNHHYEVEQKGGTPRRITCVRGAMEGGSRRWKDWDETTVELVSAVLDAAGWKKLL